MTRVIAGIGCRRHADAHSIVAAVRHACAQAGRPADALAAPSFKRDRGLHEAARLLGLPLILVGTDALRAEQPRCVTPSARAEQATGFASICEASALAAAGAGGRLLLARVVLGAATCALAES